MKLATQDQYELKMNMTCFSWQKKYTKQRNWCVKMA